MKNIDTNPDTPLIYIKSNSQDSFSKINDQSHRDIKTTPLMFKYHVNSDIRSNNKFSYNYNHEDSSHEQLIFDYEPENDVFRKYEKSRNPSITENDHHIRNDSYEPNTDDQIKLNHKDQDVNISLSKDLKIFNNELLTSESQNLSQSQTTKFIKNINTCLNNDSKLNLNQNHYADKEREIKDESNINIESNFDSDRKLIISKSTKTSVLDENNIDIINDRTIPYEYDHDSKSNSEINELNSYNSTPDR